VDDDARVRRVCNVWLTSRGHRVLEASDGREAMGILERHAVDLLLSDVDMPSMGGTALTIWWRTLKRSAAPAVLMTASSDCDGVARAVSGYGVEVLCKPFSPKELVDRIDALLLGCDGAKSG